jgi:hypothetical protein
VRLTWFWLRTAYPVTTAVCALSAVTGAVLVAVR